MNKLFKLLLRADRFNTFMYIKIKTKKIILDNFSFLCDLSSLHKRFPEKSSCNRY